MKRPLRLKEIERVPLLARVKAILGKAKFSKAAGGGSGLVDPAPRTTTAVSAVPPEEPWDGGGMYDLNDITNAPFSASGNGTTDNLTAINSAITDAVTNSRGGIFIPAGTFVVSRNSTSGTTATGSLSSFDMRNMTDFVIAGEGPRSVLKMQTAALTSGSDWYMFRIRNNVSRIWFKNLTLDGGFPLGTSTSGVDEQTHLVNLGSGSSSEGNNGEVTDIVFENVQFQNVRGDGVRLLGAGDSEVRRVRFINCTFDATHRSGIVAQRDVFDTTVMGCHFRNITDTHIDFEPTSATTGNARWVIMGNHFDRTYNPGKITITLTGDGGSTRNENCIFSHNIVEGLINALNIRAVDICHNQIFCDSVDSGDPIINIFRAVDDINICDNYIVRGGGTAGQLIYVAQNLATSPSGIKIARNTCKQYTEANVIALDNCNEVDVSENHVYYNGAGTNTIVGINSVPSISNVSGVRIRNNMIRGAAGGGTMLFGIRASGSASYATARIEVSGNDISGAQTADIKFGGPVTGFPRVHGNLAATITGSEYVTAMHTGGNSNVPDLEGWAVPEGSVTAPIGSTFRQLNATAAPVKWHKESGSGNTGWVAK